MNYKNYLLCLLYIALHINLSASFETLVKKIEEGAALSFDEWAQAIPTLLRKGTSRTQEETKLLVALLREKLSQNAFFPREEGTILVEALLNQGQLANLTTQESIMVFHALIKKLETTPLKNLSTAERTLLNRELKLSAADVRSAFVRPLMSQFENGTLKLEELEPSELRAVQDYLSENVLKGKQDIENIKKALIASDAKTRDQVLNKIGSYAATGILGYPNAYAQLPSNNQKFIIKYLLDATLNPTRENAYFKEKILASPTIDQTLLSAVNKEMLTRITNGSLTAHAMNEDMVNILINYIKNECKNAGIITTGESLKLFITNILSKLSDLVPYFKDLDTQVKKGILDQVAANGKKRDAVMKLILEQAEKNSISLSKQTSSSIAKALLPAS